MVQRWDAPQLQIVLVSSPFRHTNRQCQGTIAARFPPAPRSPTANSPDLQRKRRVLVARPDNSVHQGLSSWPILFPSGLPDTDPKIFLTNPPTFEAFGCRYSKEFRKNALANGQACMQGTRSDRIVNLTSMDFSLVSSSKIRCFLLAMALNVCMHFFSAS